MSEMRFRVTSSPELADERRLRAMLEAARVTTTDRTCFEAQCEKFRTCCGEIAIALGIPFFLGSYDEIEAILNNNAVSSIPAFQILYNKLNVLNSICKHEGEKLGYRLAEWWRYCWKDELAQLAAAPVVSR